MCSYTGEYKEDFTDLMGYGRIKDYKESQETNHRYARFSETSTVS